MSMFVAGTRGVPLAQETLRVVRWMLPEVTITEDIREKLCQKLSNVWVQPSYPSRAICS